MAGRSYADKPLMECLPQILDAMAATSKPCPKCGRPLSLYADRLGRCMPCERPDLLSRNRLDEFTEKWGDAA